MLYNIISYILPIALVSAVNKNGKVTQNHSGLIKRKAKQATRLTKVISQYFPVEDSCVLISYSLLVFLIIDGTNLIETLQKSSRFTSLFKLLCISNLPVHPFLSK